ncbi:MAG: sulfatase [Actinomycetota bacterium]|nr:sulfatase [Actinomycetota bacterium]
MRAVVLMFDSLNRHMLPPYAADTVVQAPNFERLAERTVTFDHFYAGSMPCMPARREMHTGRHNFLHRGWGPLEPFDDSMPEMLRRAGVHTHLASDHQHYWEDGGATYHTRYSTWEFFRGQEGDPWKGVVDPGGEDGGMLGRMRRQDAVNRTYMASEAEHSQTLTVDAGLHFLHTNADADRWMLQIELFDPHEPFFVHDEFKKLYGELDDPDADHFDWPGYQKVSESPELIEAARRSYAALVSMCDKSLGRLLDAMDAHDMWDDTMLIVNTDHGFLLGEHGWWAKSVMPWYDELIHLPFFVWDPRAARRGERCDALAQTIDLAPTLLDFFGVEASADTTGHDLAGVIAGDGTPLRPGALFGLFGSHVNVTDGRYTYMRGPADRTNAPLAHHTLMPTHMRSRFGVGELAAWEPADPFTFTKGLRTMKVPARSQFMNPWIHGTLLFDLETDPGQERPIIDDELELRMLGLLVERMRAEDAPAGEYERLGLPAHGPPDASHLRVALDATRAAAIAEPLPPRAELTALELLERPLPLLLDDGVAGPIVREEAADLVASELLTMAPRASLLDLAAAAQLTAEAVRRLDGRLATALDGAA